MTQNIAFMHAYIILTSDTFDRITHQVPLESNDIVPYYEQYVVALPIVAHSDLHVLSKRHFLIALTIKCCSNSMTVYLTTGNIWPG